MPLKKVKVFLAFSGFCVYVVCMIKKGTIAVTRSGGIYQVEKTFHDAVQGMVAVCRVYRSQKRVGIRVKDLRPHPLFAK